MRNKAALIFPDTLDNATVLYFTPKGDYGDLFNTIEECGYARLLASDYLAVRESPRLSYPGLTPDVFGFVGVFEPDCVFEDIEGTIYTATVRRKNGT